MTDIRLGGLGLAACGTGLIPMRLNIQALRSCLPASVAGQRAASDLSADGQPRLSRSAFMTTDTELSAIAAPANIGESRMPNQG